MKKILILLFVSFFAHAQTQPLSMKSNTEGISVGLNGNFLSWSSDYFQQLDDDEPNGFGVGLEIGYGFTQSLEVISRYEFSNLARKNDWDTFRFNNLAVLARFNFGSTTKKLRPYLEAGVGNQAMKISPVYLEGGEYEIKLNGIGFAYGGGLNYFINRNLLITANIAGIVGNMNDFKIGGVDYNEQEDVDVSNFRIRLGTRFYFKHL